ncbi:MAG TPA: tRNA lysidine(34) synthetase TilS [Chitinophagaceae bacterium]|nr:tRNA lysidine(34) synthetase TilS [Chitinophagaceae bacterium]
MLQSFRAYLKWYGLPRLDRSLIVACSGGLDSVVLCELCHQANLTFSIAHCNFRLRGAESDRDEAFVKSLGEKYSVPVYINHFDTEAHGVLKKLSIQEAARALRYAWFEELRLAQNAAFVLIAHHQNDVIETTLMALFRGTGLHGLTGMPDRKESSFCLRPLLQQTRTEIEAFAKEANLEWVEDSSNSSNKYTRNFFRNAIFPAIQNVYPQAEQNVAATIERLKKTERLYNELVDGLLKKLVRTSGNEQRIPVKKLIEYKDTSLPYELFKKFGFGEKQIGEILKLTQSESGHYIQNETHRVLKHRHWFIISEKKTTEAHFFIAEEDTKKLTLPDCSIHFSTIENVHFHLDKTSTVAQVDAAEITYPLFIRRWKTGDYFYPLGLRKKKKLARFFIDLKLPQTAKEKIWVVESGKRIVWIVDYRLDDRFKITDATKTILQLKRTSL